MRRGPLGMFVAAACLAGAPAAQAFTGSTITSPAADSYYVVAPGDPAIVDFAGTTTGATPGEQVSIRCFHGSESDELATATVAQDGTWSAHDVEVHEVNPCALRAVPAGFGANDERAPFARRDVFFRFHDGMFDLVLPLRGALWNLRALDSCPVKYGTRFDEPDFHRGAWELFDCVTRTDAAVDGADATLSVQEADVLGTTDPETGAFTRSDRADVLVCPEAICAATGLELRRTYSVAQSGRVMTVEDRWRNTDDAPHVLGLGYETNYYWNDHAAVSIDGGPLALVNEQVGVDHGHPVARLVAQTQLRHPPGHPDHGAGVVILDPAPDRSEPTGEFGALVSTYTGRTVPADGEVVITHRIHVSASYAEADAVADSYTDALDMPSVTISRPDPGTAFAQSSIRVTGTARDASHLAGLTVAGAPVPVAVDGSWETTVSLAPGPNAIVAVAKDGAGQEASASIELTYVPPASLPTRSCVVPKLKGVKRLKAIKRIYAANCSLGKMRTVKNRKRRRTGRVVRHSRAVGQILPENTKIALRIARRPKR